LNVAFFFYGAFEYDINVLFLVNLLLAFDLKEKFLELPMANARYCKMDRLGWGHVGPYLINDFVQYLDGQRLYENQDYVLVSAIFIAKLVNVFHEGIGSLGCSNFKARPHF
jgi:hypothetical protein